MPQGSIGRHTLNWKAAIHGGWSCAEEFMLENTRAALSSHVHVASDDFPAAG